MNEREFTEDERRRYAAIRRSQAYRDLRAAVDNDHPCEDNACDIGMAREQDLYLWAAHIFSGATEMSDAFDAAWKELNLSWDDPALELERLELLKIAHWDCPKCGAVVWDEDNFKEPVTCSNCHHEFPRNKYRPGAWAAWKEAHRGRV